MINDLRIAELPAGTLGGLIGITFAPGKKGPSAYGGFHDRDLAADMDVVAAWDAAAVVTLMEADELDRYRIGSIGEEVRARFMEWHNLPIRDVSTPDAAFEAEWPARSARLRGLVAAGNRVLVHCRGGLGRAGMIAARLLVEMGQSPDEAIATVRHERPGAIETTAQEDWVRAGGEPLTVIDQGDAAMRDRAVGALLGLAVGDAVGTTIEFSAKPDRAVLTDMVGGGPFRLRAGQWTDDTAMALALADSLLVDPELDLADLMRRFVSWYRDGTYSCTGTCFDIGVTTSGSLRRHERTGECFAGPTGPDTAGNGSIMRLAPVAIRHRPNRDVMVRVARDQSRTTHGAEECLEACETLALILADAIRGAPVQHLIARTAAQRVKDFRPGQPRAEVRGTGYVVASLHASLWAVSRTSSFKDAVLLAANLGEDADTTAAVAGQIAGAVYGASGIPADWLGKLAWREQIERRATELHETGSTLAPTPRRAEVEDEIARIELETGDACGPQPGRKASRSVPPDTSVAGIATALGTTDERAYTFEVVPILTPGPLRNSLSERIQVSRNMTVHTPVPVVSIEEQKANAFAEILREHVRELAEEQPGEGMVLDAHLLSVCMDYLEDQGGIDGDVGEGADEQGGMVPCQFRAKIKNTTVSVLGYTPVDSNGQLTLFAARYEGDATEKTLPVNDYRSRVEQAVKFFRLAYNEPELLLPFDEAKELVKNVTANSDRISGLRVVFVTNLRLNSKDEKKADKLGDIDVVFDTYDIDRLHKLSNDATSASDIVIDFAEVIGRAVPCLEATGRDHAYKSYLLILEGTTIHWLFKRYGPRLYDTNLRSYLDNKTKVNKDIIKTVREQPDRFLAYNNGLTATAQEIEVSTIHGQPCISRIVGLQIVNGAQTTGSIFKALEGLPKNKRGEVDLSQVSVSVKLTKVVGDDLKEFVPRITRYANTQNPIQAADLEANEELHRRMEELSNDIWCPGTTSRWFYERTRGSYQAAMNREGTTPKRKADFKREVPKDQKFGKTDLARVWMAWNGHPHLVSKGAQKNFDAFKKIISSSEGGLPIEAVDETFYRSVVAMALLFKAASSAVSSAKIGGGVGSMAKAYLASYLAHRLGDRIDLERVWQNQGVSEELQALLDEWAPLVYERMILNAGQHTTEWFKKENCWLDVQGLELAKPAGALPDYRLPAAEKPAIPPISAPVPSLGGAAPIQISAPPSEPAKSRKLALDLEDDVAVTRALTEADWVKAYMWLKDAEGFSNSDERFALSMAQHANNGWEKGKPTVNQAKWAAKIARSVIRAGALELA